MLPGYHPQVRELLASFKELGDPEEHCRHRPCYLVITPQLGDTEEHCRRFLEATQHHCIRLQPPSPTVAASITYDCRRFLEATRHLEESDALDAAPEAEGDGGDTPAVQPAGMAGDSAGAGAAGGADGGAALGLEVLFNHVRVAPQYSLAALRPGVFVLGMKEQLTVHDLPSHPLQEQVQCVTVRGGGGLSSTPCPATHHTPCPATLRPPCPAAYPALCPAAYHPPGAVRDG